MKPFGALPFMVLVGCGVATGKPSPPESKTLKGWVLLSRPYSQLPEHVGRAGEARVAPDALAVVLEPVFADDPAEVSVRPICRHTLRLLCSQPGPLAVGETATAEIAVDGGPDDEHTLVATATRTGIDLLTPPMMTVPAQGVVRIRFRAASAGQGGIVIRILECRKAK